MHFLLNISPVEIKLYNKFHHPEENFLSNFVYLPEVFFNLKKEFFDQIFFQNYIQDG
jgi:hypothetical protein